MWNWPYRDRPHYLEPGSWSIEKLSYLVLVSGDIASVWSGLRKPPSEPLTPGLHHPCWAQTSKWCPPFCLSTQTELESSLRGPLPTLPFGNVRWYGNSIKWNQCVSASLLFFRFCVSDWLILSDVLNFDESVAISIHCKECGIEVEWSFLHLPERASQECSKHLQFELYTGPPGTVSKSNTSPESPSYWNKAVEWYV